MRNMTKVGGKQEVGVIGGKAEGGRKKQERKRKVTIARQTMNAREQGKRGLLSQWMLEVRNENSYLAADQNL